MNDSAGKKPMTEYDFPISWNEDIRQKFRIELAKKVLLNLHPEVSKKVLEIFEKEQHVNDSEKEKVDS